MRFLFSLSVMLLVSISVLFAQNPDVSPSSDFNPINPNTVRAIAKVKSIKKDSVIIIIEEVIGSGQGIINVLSAGQELGIDTNSEKRKLLAGDKIEVDLKEKLGVDASQSYYVLLNVKKLKR